MSTPADIIERIKKLLRLAQRALERAMALAAEHRVAIEGLNPDEAEKEKATTHRDTDPLARLSYDKRYALAICRIFFRVSTVEVECIRLVDRWPCRGVKMTFVGTRSDIEVALYIYEYLARHFAFCWRRHGGRLRNRQAFVHGMYLGLREKLYRLMPEPESPEAKGTELIVAGHDAYIAAVIGKTENKKSRAPDHAAHAAALAGYIHGQKTEIRTALKPAAEQVLALA